MSQNGWLVIVATFQCFRKLHAANVRCNHSLHGTKPVPSVDERSTMDDCSLNLQSWCQHWAAENVQLRIAEREALLKGAFSAWEKGAVWRRPAEIRWSLPSGHGGTQESTEFQDRKSEYIYILYIIIYIYIYVKSWDLTGIIVNKENHSQMASIQELAGRGPKRRSVASIQVSDILPRSVHQ